MKTTRILTILAAILFAASSNAADRQVATPVAQSDTVTVSGKLTPIPFPTDTDDVEAVRQAGVRAIDLLLTDFIARESQSARYAVMPLDRDFDDGYFAMQLRGALANRGKAVGIAVVTRDPTVEKQFIAEIGRGNKYGDTMDPVTIQKFGRVQGVTGIIVGRLTGIYEVTQPDAGPIRLEDQLKKVLQVRISLQAYEVETGRQLWGAEKSGIVRMTAEDAAIVIPGTRRGWILYGGGALVLVIVAGIGLFYLWRHLKFVNRPR